MAIRELTQFSILDYNNANDSDIEAGTAPKFVAMRLFEKMAEEGKLDEFGGAENVRRVRHMSDDSLAFDFKRPVAEIQAERRQQRMASQKLLVYGLIGSMFRDAVEAAKKATVERATLLLVKRYPEALPEGDAERQKAIDDSISDAKAQLAREAKQRIEGKGSKKPFLKRQNGPRNDRKHQGRGKSRPTVERVSRPNQAR